MRVHRRRADGPSTVIDGLSSRTLAEITRLELTRNYLAPGGVGEAVRCWKDHVRQPRGALRHDDEYGSPHWICCGDPRAARALLGLAMRAMSRSGARELRRVVDGLDRER
ncbi:MULTISPECIES: hypothetical protein [Streptomyces]|uniref:hypothetical protein n=1 Tax=Streptomyces TaxID=1883 RepID=UPI0023B0552C|nr:hypothetical protein [Streptomyces sp. KA12]MDF0372062.1 hypothetical protein [Streptomyces sp. KA12]